MMNAYEKHYLYDAMINLANAVDCAVNEYKLNPDDFSRMFIVSGLSKQFGMGNPKYVAGMSGGELTKTIYETVNQTRDVVLKKPRAVTIVKTPEYWAGWITAYWQWKTGRSFREIFENIKLSEIIRMYHPYHEMDENSFVETAEDIISKRQGGRMTKLAAMRIRSGLSQSQLASKAGVNIRNIQQYEQRAKDISKAGADTVLRLARALNCEVEDLIETEIIHDS
ncbi:MAG: helix-turn-helix transcriptional regulator [Lachnospiraceae bacterium]|nr:helix-turn-helix transcriptional regulator [Lachnospiraceae bacterium]